MNSAAEMRRFQSTHRRALEEARRRAEAARQAAIARQRAIDDGLRNEVQANIAKDSTIGEDLDVRKAAVEALWESLGTWISVRFWDSLLERYIGAARAQLGAEADAVWAEGRALAFDDAVELALAD